ncbi:2302_t:CDS:1, partial [Acaulospora colombiana]
MITQDIQTENSDKSKNIQETEQSKNSFALFTVARIDKSNIKMKKSSKSNQTKPKSSGQWNEVLYKNILVNR